MTLTVDSSDPSKALSGNYSNQDVSVVLELAVQRVLMAEAAVRAANANLAIVLESAFRNAQGAQARAAIQSLRDRRAS
jgi:hypothetical protein